MKTIAVANQKGGVGKTTTSVNLAHGLALRGYEVLLIDLDPQGHCASALGRSPEPGVFKLLIADQPLKDVVRTTGRPHLTLLPGDKRTGTAHVVLVAEGRLSRDLLLNLLRPAARTGLDFCIIDASPSVSGLQEAALYAADALIIPTGCDYLSAQGVGTMLEMLRTVNAQGGDCRLFGVLPTFYDDQTRESRATVAKLRADLGLDAILPPIHRATVLKECAARGKTVFEYAPEGRAMREYTYLLNWVEDVCRTLITNRAEAVLPAPTTPAQIQATSRLSRLTNPLPTLVTASLSAPAYR